MNEDSAQKLHLFAVGATHHRVPIEVREKLALGAAAADQLQGTLRQISGLEEFAILNTCNRVEFYGVTKDPSAEEQVRSAFCHLQRFPREEFDRVCMAHGDVQAIRHLFEVASGLDSQMLGETEIFGQVKEAYARAQAKGCTGVVLNKLFQKAFHAAKQVRSETAISVGQVSVSNVAVELAADIFGALTETKILLVGAGEIGEKTARAFQSRGASSLTVCSRTGERALELATELGGVALPYDQREARIAEFDIIVCATSAPGTVISAEASALAMKRRPARPLLFIDLALPRDVEAGVSALQNVFLYNLDDLAKVADENRRARESQVGKAREILEEKASRFWSSLSNRLGPDVTA